MTKQESPNDPSKLPGKVLYAQQELGDTSATDNKIDKLRQQVELLAYFDALSDKQRFDILSNLRADMEESEFMDDNAVNNEHIAATPDKIEKAELYDNMI